MVSFEDIGKRIFADRRWLPNLLIGGVLSFIPLVNIFALGYLYRYFGQIHRGGGFEWPEWNDWEGLFVDGLRLLAVAALYGFLPVLVALGAAQVLGWASLGLFGHVAYMLAAPLMLVTPLWVMAMLYAFQPRRRWQVLGRPVLAILMTRAAWPELLVPSLAFWGLMALGWPVFGFAFFLGFLVLGAYYTRLFLEIESRGLGRPPRG
ncbi:MAG: DUF4013 domain-containing protein [Opitutales bacterium]|jgi:hypothetical protein